MATYTYIPVRNANGGYTSVEYKDGVATGATSANGYSGSSLGTSSWVGGSSGTTAKATTPTVSTTPTTTNSTSGGSGKTYTNNGNGTTTITYANEAQAKANGVTSGLTRTVSNNDTSFQSAYNADTKTNTYQNVPAYQSSTTTVKPTTTTATTATKPVATTPVQTTPAPTMAQQAITSGGGDTGASKIIGDAYNTGMSGWTNAGTGSTGKTYAVSNNNNSIQVQYADGSVRTVTPGMADYNAVYNAMQQDLQSNGINYTPTYTTEVHRNVVDDGDGGYMVDYNTPSTFQTINYTAGNAELQRELQNAAQTNPGISTNDYVKALYNSLGTQKADGTNVTVQDIDAKLSGLGLNDYTSQKAIFTAGRDILPGGQAKDLGYGVISDAPGGDIMIGGSPQGGLYYTYGGQDYLIGGDAADYAKYANFKNAEINRNNPVTASDLLFGGLGNNQFMLSDPDAMASYNNYMNSIRDYTIGYNGNPNQYNGDGSNPLYSGSGSSYSGNNTAYGTGNVTNNYNQSYTGNPNVDSAIGNINNILDYAVQTGDSDLYNSIKQLLDSGLSNTQEWLATQKSQAEANAEKQARGARINQLLQQQAMNEAYSAAGIGTTGAVQSGMQAINDSYGKNIGDINANLANMINNLNDQELKALGDYYQNLGQYKYNITNDDLNRQYQYAQMAQNQQQFDANMAMQQQELAWKQQQAEADRLWQQQQADADRAWQEKVYNDSIEQSRLAAEAEAYKNQYDANISQRDYALKAIQAGYTSPELAAALGIPYEEAVALAQQYAAKNTYYKGSTSSGGGNPRSSDPIGPDLGDIDEQDNGYPGFYINSLDLTNQYLNKQLPLDQNGMPITQASLMAGLYDPLTRR